MTGGYRADVLATAQAILAGPLGLQLAVQTGNPSENRRLEQIVVDAAILVVERVRAIPKETE